MFDLSRQYFLFDQPTDMRKSFNTLGALVKQQMKLDVLSGAGFLFINKRGTHLKLLVWEEDGFSIYFKRLEQGTFHRPLLANQYQINRQKVMLMLFGLDEKMLKKRKRFASQSH